MIDCCLAKWNPHFKESSTDSGVQTGFSWCWRVFQSPVNVEQSGQGGRERVHWICLISCQSDKQLTDTIISVIVCVIQA